jgi:flagellar biogenesis protein FliO
MKLSATEPRPNGKELTKVQSTILAIATGIWKKAVSVLRSARVQRRERALQIVERLALGNKQSIVLVRVDKQEYVVGCCGDSMVLLGSRNSGQEKTERRKAQPIPVQITNLSQGLTASQPETTPRPKTARRNVQTVDQTPLQAAARSARTPSRKTKQSKMPPPTRAQLLKSFAGRIQ